MQAWQKAALTVVKNRFPSLTDIAQQTIPNISKVDVLEFLTAKISGAPDENFGRTLLHMSAA